MSNITSKPDHGIKLVEEGIAGRKPRSPTIEGIFSMNRKVHDMSANRRRPWITIFALMIIGSTLASCASYSGPYPYYSAPDYDPYYGALSYSSRNYSGYHYGNHHYSYYRGHYYRGRHRGYY